MSEASIRKTGRTSVLTAVGQLPYSDGTKVMTLSVFSDKSAFNLYIDNRLVYSYGITQYENNRQLGCGYHFVDITREDCAKSIRLEMFAGENGAFSNLEDMKLIHSSDAYVALASGNFLLIVTCSFLMVFGMLVSLAGAGQFFVKKSFCQFLYIGIYSFLMGIYLMGYNGLLQLFSEDLILNTAIEHFALYLIMVPILMFTIELCNDKHGWFCNLLKFIVLMDLVMTACVAFLYAKHWIHINVVAPVYRGIMMFCLVLIVVMTITGQIKRSKANYIFISGYIVMAVSSIIGIFCYEYYKYVGYISPLEKYCMPLGNIYFILTLLFSYLLNYMNHFKNSVERKTLLRMAYHDSMTNLFNRAKSVEIFEKLENLHKEYTVISFDLNFLKRTNDTYGHEEGDKLLINFAAILHQSFGEYGHVCRMGGDEFMVIMEVDSKNNIIQKCIKTMKEMMKEDNDSGENKYEMHTSYGIACSTEIPENISDKVCALADKRMYEMKVRSKKARE